MPKKKGEKVSFKFRAPKGSQKVCLVGDFNNWDKESHTMTPKGEDWLIVLNIEPGHYEYKFFADGVWYNDPNATRQTSNVWGSENSLIIIE